MDAHLVGEGGAKETHPLRPNTGQTGVLCRKAVKSDPHVVKAQRKASPALWKGIAISAGTLPMKEVEFTQTLNFCFTLICYEYKISFHLRCIRFCFF